MYATHDASAAPGTERNTSLTPLHLPSFTPTRDSLDRRESQDRSSTSGSRWSAVDERSRTPSDARAGSSIVGSNDAKHEQHISNNAERKSRNRSSGGFLLEPTTHSSRLSRALLSNSIKDAKGKRKSEVSDIWMPKRRNRQSLLEQDVSKKSSPLSVEVRRDQDVSFNRSGSSSIKNQPGGETPTNGMVKGSDSQRSGTPSVGLDTDPAQIVDMALKLSEGRRRQASGRRLVSNDSPRKRVVSTASSRQLGTPTRNLGQYITSPNIVAPSSGPENSILSVSQSGTPDTMAADVYHSGLLVNEYPIMEDRSIEISRATAARAERAKTYIELSYEHRRLLSHLPPIQKPGTQAGSGSETPSSKCYNPLQYARNRKLRIREKSAIDAEAEGWHDIEKVRAWVDAVINSHTETRHDPLECVRLPPLSLQENHDDPSQSQSMRTSPQSSKQQQTRPRRPKSDWVTHPGDLIADAFWLEQGLNKTKISDKDNNSIYPAQTPFKFSGWRNRTPGVIPANLQQRTPPPDSPDEKPAQPLPAAPELPTFRSARRNSKNGSRSRKRLKLKNASAKNISESRRRKFGLIGDSSDSDVGSNTSSHKSDDEQLTRGRKRTSREFFLPDGDPFGKPISHIIVDGDTSESVASVRVNRLDGDSARSSIDSSRLGSYFKRKSTQKAVSRDRGRSRGNSKRNSVFSRTKEHKSESKHERKSLEYDTASSNSPANYGLPSIAINLDAPISRSPSPTKKSKSSLLQSLKPKHNEHEKIETNDFAIHHDSSHSRSGSLDAGPTRDSSNHTSRGTSPLTRGLSPFSRLSRESTGQDSQSLVNLDHRASTISKHSTRPLSISNLDQPSRIRGMFKGGRIAELVGNEVSRVGEFIWKRDIPPTYRHQKSGSDASLHTFESSATDEDAQNGHLHHKASRKLRPSSSTISSTASRRSQDGLGIDLKPVLHNPNLPTFTSPFQRDRDKQDQKQNLLQPGEIPEPDDHISRQAAQHRHRSKSPRMDHLALPKIDTGAPMSVGILERKNSYGFGGALNRSQSASRLFNNAIQAKNDRNTSTRSSTAGLSNMFRQSVASTIRGEHSDSINKHDLTRVRSLLLISAVKARSINMTYNQIPSEPSKLLLDTVNFSTSSLTKPQALQVRRRDQHVITARNLIAQIAYQNNQINNRLHSFSNTTVIQLHRQIQMIEDQIENTITPRVRTTADNAGELSVKLTTTSTQAVKGLHDTITEAFRLQRRGPFRWVRLLGYTIIEWTVVGLLWFIWAIVTVVRLFVGIGKGTVKTVRWLLWID